MENTGRLTRAKQQCCILCPVENPKNGKFLSCLHIICGSCFDKGLDDAGNVTCNLCGICTKRKYEQVDLRVSLLDSYPVLSAMAQQSEGNPNTATAPSSPSDCVKYCDWCTDIRVYGTPASHKCSLCGGMVLCEDHQKVHATSPYYYPGHDIAKLPVDSDRDDYCFFHAGCTVEMYCTDCSSCICLQCVLSDEHMGHKQQTLSKIAGKLQRQLEAQQNYLARQRNLQIKQYTANRAKIERDTGRIFEQAKRQYDLLGQLSNEYKKYAEDQVNDCRQHLASLRKEWILARQQLQQANEVASHLLLGKGNTADIATIRFANDVISSLRVCSAKYQQLLKRPDHYTVSINCKALSEVLSPLLSGLGEMGVKDPPSSAENAEYTSTTPDPGLLTQSPSLHSSSQAGVPRSDAAEPMAFNILSGNRTHTSGSFHITLPLSSTNDPQLRDRQIGDVAHCQVCLTRNPRNGKFLSCLHIICSDCLNEVLDDTGNVTCRLCNACTKRKYEEVDLKTSLLDSQPVLSLSAQHTKDNSSDNIGATSFKSPTKICETRKEEGIHVTAVTHKGIERKGLDHRPEQTMAPSDKVHHALELDDDGTAVDTGAHCPLHPACAVVLFCMECACCQCLECIKSRKHSGHRQQAIPDAAGERRKEIETCRNALAVDSMLKEDCLAEVSEKPVTQMLKMIGQVFDNIGETSAKLRKRHRRKIYRWLLDLLALEEEFEYAGEIARHIMCGRVSCTCVIRLFDCIFMSLPVRLNSIQAHLSRSCEPRASPTVMDLQHFERSLRTFFICLCPPKWVKMKSTSLNFCPQRYSDCLLTM